MTPLLAAVYAQLKGEPDIGAIFGVKIYGGRALNNEDMPYLVFGRQGSFPPVYYTTKTQQVEHVIIRFHVWSIDSEEASSAIEEIETLFRVTSPVLSSGTVMQVTRQSDNLAIDPTPTSDGNDVWHGIIDLDFMLQRNPTV